MPPAVDHPPELFQPGLRHLVVLAHQDDELPNAGILHALQGEVRYVWLTNGDGIHDQTDWGPERYGQVRTDESIAAMAQLGVSTDRLAFLGHSELAIFDALATLSRDAAAPVPAIFETIAGEVEAQARAFEPDIVWTQAWQGGHPEHDLAHLCAARVARLLGHEAPLPLYEFPAYELTILIPLRFAPWRPGTRHVLTLDDDAFARKMAMFACYPTQQKLLDDFQKLITLYGRLARLRGRPFTFEQFAREEHFGPVPPDRDYTRSTHRWPFFDYLFDDYQGTPIRFPRTLPRIAQSYGLSAR